MKEILRMVWRFLWPKRRTKKDNATSSIIRHWLQPSKDPSKRFSPLTIQRSYGILLTLYKACDKAKVQAHVRAMDYPEFLSTPYWFVLSKYLKMYDDCRKCRSERNKQVHHKTYKHLGIEILYQSDLVVLCDKCHAKEHKK